MLGECAEQRARDALGIRIAADRGRALAQHARVGQVVRRLVAGLAVDDDLRQLERVGRLGLGHRIGVERRRQVDQRLVDLGEVVGDRRRLVAAGSEHVWKARLTVETRALQRGGSDRTGVSVLQYRLDGGRIDHHPRREQDDESKQQGIAYCCSAGMVVRATVESIPAPRPRPSRSTRPVAARELDGEARFPDVFGPGSDEPTPIAHDLAEVDEPLVDLPPPFDPDPVPEAEPSDSFELPEIVVDGEPGDEPPYHLPDAARAAQGHGRDRRRSGCRAHRAHAARRTLRARRRGPASSAPSPVRASRVTSPQLAPGTKVSRVSGLRDDLAYALATTELRILAPIPGKQAVGVDVRTARRTSSRSATSSRSTRAPAPSPLSVWLGKDIAGHPSCTPT